MARRFYHKFNDLTSQKKRFSRNWWNKIFVFIFTAIIVTILCRRHPFSYHSEHLRKQGDNHPRGRRIIFVTPTYKRATQIAELVRLKQTLNNVPNCDWLVVEDAPAINPIVFDYIKDFKPGKLLYIAKNSDERNEVVRAREQRNHALDLIESRSSPFDIGNSGAVVYFADDDNTYDASFLDLIRSTSTISLFNVGLLPNMSFEGPIIDKQGKIVGFQTSFPGNRTFCTDMAGFAVSMEILKRNPGVRFSSTEVGDMENDYLKKFNLPLSEFEYIQGRNGIHVWHTQTIPVTASEPLYAVYINANSSVVTRKYTNYMQYQKQERERIQNLKETELDIFWAHLKKLEPSTRDELAVFLRENLNTPMSAFSKQVEKARNSKKFT